MTKEIYKSKQHLKIKRTYNYLGKAMRELLREKTLEEISVVDICDRALVHRTTFYKHFEDKYHLFNCMIEELIEEFEISLQENDYKDFNEYLLDFSYSMFKFARVNKNIFYAILIKNNTKIINDMLYYIASNRIKIMLKDNNITHLTTSLNIEIEFVVGGILSSLVWIIKNDIDIEEEGVMKTIEKMINLNV